MFSGKTETLIRRIQELRDAGYAVAVFRPFVDTRSPGDGLRSHSGLELAATVVSTADELRQRVSEKDQFVAIDEAQFFDEGIVDVCLDLAGAGKHLLVSGLDLDFRGMPFGPMPRLLACAQRIHKLAARCSVCGEAAFFSQRLVNGRPAAFFERVVLPGGAELYQPRCRKHHEVPGQPARITRTTREELDWQLLDWVNRLRAVAQTGLHFCNNTFDRERYGSILAISHEMALAIGIGQTFEHRFPADQVHAPSTRDVGYVTPKVAVAVAAFNERGAMLLVRRADTGSWALPGGWAEVGLTPVENAANEVYQETGLSVRCDGLVGVYDTRLNPVGLSQDPAYTLVFHGVIVGGTISLHREEILEARFFDTKELLELQTELQAGTVVQVRDALQYHVCPSGSPHFDIPGSSRRLLTYHRERFRTWCQNKRSLSLAISNSLSARAST
jgi:thymidine kinase